MSSVDGSGIPPRFADLVALPPGSGFLRLPTSSRASFRSSLVMWPACRASARLVCSLIAGASRLLGPRALLSVARSDWTAPWTDETWGEIHDQLTGWFGPFDAMAWYTPRQRERRGAAALLLQAGHPTGFVKLRPGNDFEREAHILQRLQGLESVRVPEPVGRIELGGWTVLGTSAVAAGRTSPRLRQSPQDVADEVGELLKSMVVLEPDQPRHWLPMHGDMGPWNLRREASGRRVLYDWEHVTNAPPGSDVVFHAAACQAMRIGGEAPDVSNPEAVSYWMSEIPRRFGAGSADQKLAQQMMSALASFKH